MLEILGQVEKGMSDVRKIIFQTSDATSQMNHKEYSIKKVRRTPIKEMASAIA